jgi:L-aspartate oxidase
MIRLAHCRDKVSEIGGIVQAQCDFLVIGSGVAGMSYALKVADRGSVILVTKRALEESNTRYAQGGIAAVWDEDDSHQAHIEDTLAAGGSLCRREAVEKVVVEGPVRVQELIDLGVAFSRSEGAGTGGDDYDLGREGGHTDRRILHAKDKTGAEIVRALVAKVRAHERIEIRENWMAVDLITGSWLARRSQSLPPVPDLVRGAYVLDLATERVEVIGAKVIALCTGGAGKVYRYTSNPDVASGDGVAMAYRAGARILNMEFVQFHPTCLFHRDAKRFLISEALRGEGGKLRLANGERFMDAYDDRGELAPRDVVARAIDSELKRSGAACVYLDMTHHSRDFLEQRFPLIFGRCLELNINIATDPIPVVPAAHYFCGGVATDLQAESSLRNLFVVGEAACTGLHGANRLASNSLLEGIVFAHSAAEASMGRLENNQWVVLPEWDSGQSVDSDELVVIQQTWEEIRRFMWNYVGVVRTTRRLKRARHRVDLLREEIHNYYWDFRLTADLVELRNLVQIAGLVVESALARRESRGLHFTLDFPSPDPRWLRDTELRKRT